MKSLNEIILKFKKKLLFLKQISNKQEIGGYKLAWRK